MNKIIINVIVESGVVVFWVSVIVCQYNGANITIIYSINNTYCTKKCVFYAVQDGK